MTTLFAYNHLKNAELSSSSPGDGLIVIDSANRSHFWFETKRRRVQLGSLLTLCIGGNYSVEICSAGGDADIHKT